LNILLIAIGGFFGAITRYFIANKIPLIKGTFPSATFFVNLTGSFVLGFLMGIMPPTKWALFIGVGFLGSYTTFSTFKVEMIRQFQEKKWKPALAYMLLSYFGGILLAFLGYISGDNL